MFKVHVNNGEQEQPQDDIYYIVAKEGIFLKKKVGVMESIAPVQNISILNSVNTMARMHIKKIPGIKFARVVAFFKEVYKQYFGEAVVLLFYDEKTKNYKIVPPHQKVTGASCDYNKGISLEGMQMIGTIHSHASMSAFHSGTDDHDEKHFDGLHITVGHVNNDAVSISASIVSNGHRFVVEPEEYIEKLKAVEEQVIASPMTRSYQWINGQLIETTNPSFTSTTKTYKRYTVDVNEKYHKVIDKWMGMVEKGTYAWNIQRRNQAYINKWGYNYSSDFWYQDAQQPPYPNQYKCYTTPVASCNQYHPSTIQPKQLQQMDLFNKDIPCSSCKHKSLKLMIEQEDIDDTIESDVFICKKCNEVIVDDELHDIMPICPNCKTDDYMVLIDEEEYPDRFEAETKETDVKKAAQETLSNYIKCPECGNTFNLFHGETECPFCYHNLIEKGGEFSKEVEFIDQVSKDSGNLLDEEHEKANQAALKEITAIKIPDPSEDQIPLPESRMVEEQTERDNLFYMFKRIFGGKK
jgi:Zn finger protein HypA/HybF involved in hydrogenase expression